MQNFKSIQKCALFIAGLLCISVLFVVIQNRNYEKFKENEVTASRKVRESDANSKQTLQKNPQKINQPYYYEEQRPVVVHAENYINGQYQNDEWNYASTKDPTYVVNQNFNNNNRKDNNWNYGSNQNSKVNDWNYGANYAIKPNSDKNRKVNDWNYGANYATESNSNDNRKVEDWNYNSNANTAELNSNDNYRNLYDYEYDQPVYAPDARDMTYNTEKNLSPSSPLEKENLHKPESVAPPKSSLEVFISVVKDLKTMWNIYQAFSAAFNSKPISNETQTVIHPRLTKMPAESQDIQNNVTNDSEREKRQSTELATTKESARYIKGDPLKGYYDFVITEGSYKFWAVFQVGTAILIIYSTFAAIYYSKVNPLVSDYDYADYLGAARSFPADNFDFVDPEDNDMPMKEHTENSWYTTMLPKIGRSLKTVLETIDKLPNFEQKQMLYDKSFEKESNRDHITEFVKNTKNNKMK